MNMNIRTIPIVGEPPVRATIQSAAGDLVTHEAFELHPGHRHLVKTGISIALPPDCCALILPRSGLALKYGITVANSPGLIDADYRGEIGVVLVNAGSESVRFNAGDRVAQLMVQPYIQPTWAITDALCETERGAGGFGSTGIGG